MKLVKKISAKDVLGQIIPIVSEMAVGEQKQAYAVAGIVSAYAQGVSNYGQWTRFEGDIQAVNHITGEVLRGKGVHMPEVLESALLAGIADTSEEVTSKAKKNEQYFEIASPIEFAYVVEIERLEDDEKGGLSYKWHCNPKTEVASNDNLSHLLTLLEAPKAEPKATAKKGAK